jgi:DNA polymerase
MSNIKIKNLINVYEYLGVSYISNKILTKAIIQSTEPTIKVEKNKESESVILPPKQAIKIIPKPQNITTTTDEYSADTKIIKEPTKQEPIQIKTSNYVGNLESISKINQDLKNINSYQELQIYMETFSACDLSKTANHTVLGDGNINSKILVVGEAPGKEEDLAGKPFVGRSGMLLMAALKDIGLKRDGDNSNMFITNTVFWRPPGNRTPSEEELEICFPILTKIIELVSPQIILTVGEIPSKTLINNEKSISELRREDFKRTFNFTKKEITVKIKALYHPAYLLRMPTQKLSLWKDLISIKTDLNLI